MRSGTLASPQCLSADTAPDRICGMIGGIERYVEKLGLQFGQLAFLGDEKRKAACGGVPLTVGDERSEFGGQAGMVQFGVGLGIAVWGVGDSFAFDRIEEGFHKRFPVIGAPA